MHSALGFSLAKFIDPETEALKAKVDQTAAFVASVEEGDPIHARLDAFIADALAKVEDLATRTSLVKEMLKRVLTKYGEKPNTGQSVRRALLCIPLCVPSLCISVSFLGLA